MLCIVDRVYEACEWVGRGVQGHQSTGRCVLLTAYLYYTHIFTHILFTHLLYMCICMSGGYDISPDTLGLARCVAAHVSALKEG